MPDLTDDQAYALLHKALLTLGRDTARTTYADTALTTARAALVSLQIGLVAASERQAERKLPPPPY